MLEKYNNALKITLFAQSMAKPANRPNVKTLQSLLGVHIIRAKHEQDNK
jgi:hypothetical protein